MSGNPLMLLVTLSGNPPIGMARAQTTHPVVAAQGCDRLHSNRKIRCCGGGADAARPNSAFGSHYKSTVLWGYVRWCSRRKVRQRVKRLRGLGKVFAHQPVALHLFV